MACLPDYASLGFVLIMLQPHYLHPTGFFVCSKLITHPTGSGCGFLDSARLEGLEDVWGSKGPGDAISAPHYQTTIFFVNPH